MNKRLQILIVSLLACFLIGLTTSCSDDPVTGCTDPAAENYNSDAEEDDGSCTYARDKFIGTYDATEACMSNSFSWPMTITASGTSNSVIILQNLGDYGLPVEATASGNNLTIDYFDSNSGITVTGSGTISGNILTITYIASNTVASDNCTATCTKQ